MTGGPPAANRGLRVAGALFLWGLFTVAALAPLAPLAVRAAEPPKAPGTHTDRKWEGLVRRQGGLRLWGRWRPGTLSLREETLRWSDAKDPGRSLLVPVARIASHRRVCRDPNADVSCFEWSLRTKDGDQYVFRSRRPGNGPSEVFAALLEIAPAAAHVTAAGMP